MKSKVDPVTDEPRLRPVRVRVHATKCERVPETGEWDIWFEAREMSKQDQEALRVLFPNLLERVYEIMDKELLLQAMTP